ncbi:MAG TPA: class I SAM-dependent methyltransferase [Thermoanaerobaculia bacterium]|nr:class I SAM-dependent methyltransferase [Thermoanaerobaculia bacterium]
MSDLGEQIAGLSAQQRALLEMRLAERRRQAAGGDRPSANVDDENLLLVESVDSVDDLLSRFYGRFPWPWPAKKFDYLEDPDFEIAMVNQDVGDWTHRTLPWTPRIWVAGCGVNQALIVALRFRRAQVVGSDLSVKSLELCRRMAAEMGIKNLELREESINHVTYENEFDSVICTGVIHHNAEPQVTLSRLAAALKPGGIMELMVYNRFHRIITSAFQKAVRVFGEAGPEIDFEREVALARKIVDDMPPNGALEKAFIQYMEWSESDFADLLIQPVEHSYTVESLETLARSCGLEMMVPCVSNYAKHLAANLRHDLDFQDPALREQYFALSDTRRWQVTNLLLHDKSPLLWFYLRRSDGTPRRTQREICEAFLDTRFEPCATTQRSFMRGDDGRYSLLPNAVTYPLTPSHREVREIVEAAGPDRTMREVFGQLSLSTEWPSVDRLRNQLATSAFSYLRAIA